MEEAGLDVVVASGFEAGGHRASFMRSRGISLTGTFALVPQVVDAVKIPVVAAGGIADARGVAAALTLGAHGAQIGTAFLACEESNAPAIHKEVLHGPARRADGTDDRLQRAPGARRAQRARGSVCRSGRAAAALSVAGTARRARCASAPSPRDGRI